MNTASVVNLISKYGLTVTLTRPGGATVTVKAKVRGYAPADLVAEIIEGDRQVIISNAEIAAASWPGPPKKGDQFVIDGKTTTVEACETRHLGEDRAMHVCRVRGN